MTEDLMTEVPSSNNSKDCKGNLSYTSIRLLLIPWVIFSYPYSWCTPKAKDFTRFFYTPLNNFLRFPEVDGVWKRVKGLSLNFDRQFPMPLFLPFFYNKEEKRGQKTY